MSELRLPKSRTKVELGLPGRSLQAEVFLSDYARTHAGPERVSDLLESEEAFFPAIEAGKFRLIARDALLWVRMDADAFGDTDWSGEPTESEVEAAFQDGTTASGKVIFVAPSGRSRLVDYLNDCRGFFPLFQEGAVMLVNRARVATVTAAERK